LKTLTRLKHLHSIYEKETGIDVSFEDFATAIISMTLEQYHTTLKKWRKQRYDRAYQYKRYWSKNNSSGDLK
jgi:hypothetical protein